MPAEPSLDSHRERFRRWLDDGASELHQRVASDLDGEMDRNRRVVRLLWDEGFTRWGWPEHAGGWGGSPLLRAIVAEELARRELVHENIYLMPEVLGAPVARLAHPDLVRRFLPRYLTGEDWWCQGFSEPDAGSDLASLRTAARLRDGHFEVTGQKVWTSLAQYAERCVLLTRTGNEGSAHRGITALLVDMDSPGVTVRPLDGMHGEADFSEVFFDGVQVPGDRVIGDVDGGWTVAMAVLASERATIFWMRAAWLLGRLATLVQVAGAADAAAVGEVYQQVASLRARSRATQLAAAAGTFDPPASSVDKVMMATTEKAVFDLALELLPTGTLVGDDRNAQSWRTQYLYSRAASIYGGTSEIQRNIIAQRILGLPREPR